VFCHKNVDIKFSAHDSSLEEASSGTPKAKIILCLLMSSNVHLIALTERCKACPTVHDGCNIRRYKLTEVLSFISRSLCALLSCRPSYFVFVVLPLYLNCCLQQYLSLITSWCLVILHSSCFHLKPNKVWNCAWITSNNRLYICSHLLTPLSLLSMSMSCSPLLKYVDLLSYSEFAHFFLNMLLKI
jgi:hypothetical protein